MSKKIYKTYEEAKLAVQRLGIQTKPEYLKYYKRDSRLPSTPDKKYAKKWIRDLGWIDWYDFLEKNKKTKIEKIKRRMQKFKAGRFGK